ncbi:MAG: hypothetical protein K2X29_01585 [Candidatus Obscuribacterales bacterium]|nr:hypothetical protein [Candidatus Obscuribacterales bacterium]
MNNAILAVSMACFVVLATSANPAWSNEQKLDRILGNQKEIIGKADQIIANQKTIIENQSKILKNQETIKSKVAAGK